MSAYPLSEGFMLSLTVVSFEIVEADWFSFCLGWQDAIINRTMIREKQDKVRLSINSVLFI
jgi:hypothetical protein